jgi:hypothetical protein
MLQPSILASDARKARGQISYLENKVACYLGLRLFHLISGIDCSSDRSVESAAIYRATIRAVIFTYW